MEKDFKGVWIPADIFLINGLSMEEKVLIITIMGLDSGEGCYAGNDYLAKFIQVNKSTCSSLISNLKNIGIIFEPKKFDGRKRYLSINEEILSKMPSINTDAAFGKDLSSLSKSSRQPSEKAKAEVGKGEGRVMKKRKQPSEKTNHINIDNNIDNNTTINANSEFENSQARDTVCEFLESVIFEHNLNELEKFTQQPKESFFVDKIREKGEDFVISVLEKINQHCIKKPEYLKSRKSLSGVFSTFAKNHDTKLTTDVKSEIDKIYTNLFGENYQYQKSDNRHLFELIKKVKQSLKDYKGGIDATDEEVSSGIKMMFNKLPNEYQSAEKFKLPLINTNYQQIKLSIKNGTNNFKNNNPDSFADFLRKGANFEL